MSEGNYSDDSSQDQDDCFDGPPVVAHQESTFAVLTPEACLQKAQVMASRVKEMLCCDDDDARILLRHFSWDCEKLTEGEFAAPVTVGAG